VSEKTIQRAIKRGPDVLTSMLYHIGVSRPRISSEQDAECSEFLDMHMPIVSGRNWRRQTGTTTSVFDAYFRRAKNPVGPTYFVTNILNKENIHRECKSDGCPYCHNAHPNSIKCQEPWLGNHKATAAAQQARFIALKAQVGKGTGSVVILMDFTKIEFYNTSAQDFIVTVYTYDPTTACGYSYEFCHHIAHHANDVAFVIRVLGDVLSYLDEEIKPTQLDIFCDGARKHFKQTGMLFWWFQQAAARSYKIVCHFFVSYHGHSACDAAAAHAKKAHARVELNEGILITTAEQLCQVVGSLKNHAAIVLKDIEESNEVPDDISLLRTSECHKFTFDVPSQKIFGYFKSSDAAAYWEWSVQEYNLL
jgi:hypothetical protein